MFFLFHSFCIIAYSVLGLFCLCFVWMTGRRVGSGVDTRVLCVQSCFLKMIKSSHHTRFDIFFFLIPDSSRALSYDEVSKKLPNLQSQPFVMSQRVFLPELCVFNKQAGEFTVY